MMKKLLFTALLLVPICINAGRLWRKGNQVTQGKTGCESRSDTVIGASELASYLLAYMHKEFQECIEDRRFWFFNPGDNHIRVRHMENVITLPEQAQDAMRKQAREKSDDTK